MLLAGDIGGTKTDLAIFEKVPVHVIVEPVALLGAALAGVDRPAASLPEGP
jgi:glucokinase